LTPPWQQKERGEESSTTALKAGSKTELPAIHLELMPRHIQIMIEIHDILQSGAHPSAAIMGELQAGLITTRTLNPPPPQVRQGAGTATVIDGVLAETELQCPLCHNIFPPREHSLVSIGFLINLLKL